MGRSRDICSNRELKAEVRLVPDDAPPFDRAARPRLALRAREGAAADQTHAIESHALSAWREHD